MKFEKLQKMQAGKRMERCYACILASLIVLSPVERIVKKNNCNIVLMFT